MGKLKTKVLVASTDPKFLNGSMTDLKSDYDVQIATSAEVASFLINEWEPQVTLIDGDSLVGIALPQIRNLLPLAKMGIIVLSSSPNAIKEERAFRDGSDYFISSSSPYRSLCLRVGHLVKRLSASHTNGIESEYSLSHTKRISDDDHPAIGFLAIRIYPHDFLVKRDNDIVNTTPTQFKLLLAFVSRPEHLLSRDWLREKVWENAKISHRSIDAQISKLKKQIPELDKYLVNVYGKGYILTQPQESAA